MPSTSRRSVKNTKTLCGQCRMIVKEDKEENIECDKCGKIFHALCTKLDKRQYDRLLKNSEEEYVCHLCDDDVSTAGTVKGELQQIQSKLNKLDQLQESMNFMSAKFDEVLKGISDNRKKIQNIEKENQILKTEIKSLKESVKILNNERVKNNCVVSGVNFNNDVSAKDAVIEISKSVGVDIQKDSIDDAYFLKRKNVSNPKQSLVVKFNTKSAKDKLMSVKPKLKNNESTKSVYVNDFLSKESMDLLNYARTLKSVGYHAVYSYSGRIYAKKSEITKARLIKSEEDVDAILLEATTNKFNSRRLSQKQIAVMEDSDGSEEDTQAQFISPVNAN